MIDLPRLRRAMKNDYDQMAPIREKRFNMIKHYAGSGYSNLGKEYEKPVNMTALFVKTVASYLAPIDPAVRSSTMKTKFMPAASQMEDHLNESLRQLYFGDILADAAIDALFVMAIVKTSLSAPTASRMSAYTGPGDLMMSTVDFEDFGCDTSAKCLRDCAYVWHRYIVPFDEVKDLPLFNKKARKALEPKSRDELYNPSGDERVSTIGVEGGFERYEDHVELIELYMRNSGTVYTFDADDTSDEILLEQPWVGPKCGPLHFLYYHRVPGQLFPKGPLMDSILLDASINNHWKKNDNESASYKKVVLYADASQAEIHKTAESGDWIQSNAPNNAKEVETGGPVQTLSIWTANQVEMYNMVTGNPRSFGGLGTSAKTVGQEKLIAESASTIIESHAKKVSKFASELSDSVGWYLWYNPFSTIRTVRQAPGVPDISIDRELTPDDRYGVEYEELGLKLDPYSMVAKTPQETMAMIDEMVKTVIIPLMPSFQNPASSSFMEAYIRLAARLKHIPELLQLLDHLIGIPPQQEETEGSQEQQPVNEPRVYERISRPGQTDRGHQQVMEQMMQQSINGEQQQQ